MSTAPSGSVWALYLQQLCLVAVVSVSVDALSEPGVKLLQWLHLGAIRLRHGSPQELLKNRNRFEVVPAEGRGAHGPRFQTCEQLLFITGCWGGGGDAVRLPVCFRSESSSSTVGAAD